MSEQQPITQHFDQYYAYEYGDFAIKKTRFGVYTSYNRELLDIVTGGTYESCMYSTMAHLKWKRDGYVAPPGKESTKSYSSSVGVKL